MKVRIGRNDVLPDGEYELTDLNKLERAKKDLYFEGTDRQILIKYDGIGGRILKDGTLISPQSLWNFENNGMNKPIEQFSDDELLVIIRRSENTNIPGSLFQRANNEWQIRHQNKILEATRQPHTGIFINARNIKNNGSITGPVVEITSESYKGRGEVSAFKKTSKNKTSNFLNKLHLKITIPLLLIIIGFVGYFSGFFEYTPSINTLVGEFKIKNSSSASSTSESQNVRSMLIGNVFDFVSDLNVLPTELKRDNFLQNYKGRKFDTSGTLINVGKFEDGNIWADIMSQTKNGSNAQLECHFDKSWEGTLNNIIDTDRKTVEFVGEIGYYIKGWVIALGCAIQKVN